MVELSALVVGGDYFKFVTGFHLMYSDNGIAWRYYKETGVNVRVLNKIPLLTRWILYCDLLPCELTCLNN